MEGFLASTDQVVARYEALLRISKSLAGHRSIAELFEVLAARLHEVVPFDYLALILHDPATDEMRLVVLEPADLPQPYTNRLPVSEGGPAAIVWQTQKPDIIPIPSTGALRPALEFARAIGRQVTCWLPLTTAHGRLGVLSFGSCDPIDYAPDAMAFMEQVAAHVAVAVENASNFERLQQVREALASERDELRLLLDLNTLLVSKHDLPGVLTNVSDALRPVVPHTRVGLTLHDPASGVLCTSAVRHAADVAASNPVVVPGDRSPAALALARGVATVFTRDDIGALGPEFDRWPMMPGTQQLCCVPLVTSRQTLGTLDIARDDTEAFMPAEIALLSRASLQVAIAVENALTFTSMADRESRLAGEKEYLEDEVRQHGEFGEIIGTSVAVRRLLKAVKTVAPTDATVLLLGETGTGKELIARAIHQSSGRQRHTFVRLSGAAVPTPLLESELFGYEKGAFTGAAAARPGRLELADGGTLFLDEVGDMALEVQAKLLRVLQEREFERLGSSRTRRVDVRIIAATNRDLDEMVADGTFRRDLYYRLSVFPIQVPPLRERQEDIPALAQYFAERFAQRMRRPTPSISVPVMTALCRWEWPGNIRELENIIQRAVILTTGRELRVPLGDLQAKPAAAVAEIEPERGTLRDVTRERILQALRDSGNVVSGPSGAAARLGVKRTTLQSMMRRLEIRRPPF
jgi:formate hydrogenlyase transcriptional activator